LAQGVDVAKLQAKHDSSAAVEQAQQLRVTAEAERQKIKHEKEEQEARLRRRPLDVSQPDDPGVLSTLELIAVTGGVGIVAAPILRSKFIQLANRNQELEARVAVLETALAEMRAALATREPH
jgi:outer membrane murein-binding lipoprotein Lpp